MEMERDDDGGNVHTTGRTDGKLSAERRIPNERDGIKKSVVAFFSAIFHLSRFPQMLIICGHIKLVVRAETTLPAGCGRRMKEWNMQQLPTQSMWIMDSHLNVLPHLHPSGILCTTAKTQVGCSWFRTCNPQDQRVIPLFSFSTSIRKYIACGHLCVLVVALDDARGCRREEEAKKHVSWSNSQCLVLTFIDSVVLSDRL